MQHFDVVVVIPVGPNTKHAFVRDTIRSFMHYTTSSYKILIADDSRQGIGAAVQADMEAVDVMCTKKPSGSMAGLYITLSKAYSHALHHYSFRALLKLDTDALIIGPAPEQEALALFEAQPVMAIAGQYPLDYDGQPWDVGWPRSRILNGTMTWKFIRRPFANIILRRLYLRALKNGYRTGESVFGGAYFMSRNFLQALHDNRMLPDYRLRTLNMGEDHLFGLLAKSIGMELGNLSAGGLPFGCAWKGLPASPEQLYQQGKKIIHSTRSWQNMNEEQIRDYFSQKRLQVPAAIDYNQPITTNHI